ncbi:hypothetical protein TrST_g3383 [Triparma strigata]|uniref:Uncharacterized protein n=1 Tax=Triparma strigata TaxID=1606541 RepID=A0A9W7BW49_9STRA|nr:hypothetical protein TrST_g3383 [Triparma strigata]
MSEVSEALVSSSWQARLDKALLSVDTSPESRFRNLQKALQDPQLRTDLQKATQVLRDKGAKEGHPDVIDLLFPSGTTARSDLEGLSAIRTQIPELTEDLRSQVKKSKPAVNFSNRPRPKTKTSFDLPKPEEIKDEFKNIFRSTPKGLKQPDYEVIKTLADSDSDASVELRKYSEFKVAKTDSMSGEGFNTLANYILGGNEDSMKMEMTTPVLTSEGSMSFILDADVEPPAPEDATVEIETIPSRVVAVKSFPGLVTSSEVDRQKEKLLSALENAEVAIQEDAEPFVLQYNSPLTIPWRRRNEIAVVVVFEEGEEGEVEEGVKSGNSWFERVEVMSWYDAGVRL